MEFIHIVQRDGYSDGQQIGWLAVYNIMRERDHYAILCTKGQSTGPMDKRWAVFDRTVEPKDYEVLASAILEETRKFVSNKLEAVDPLTYQSTYFISGNPEGRNVCLTVEYAYLGREEHLPKPKILREILNFLPKYGERAVSRPNN
jgi:hypothetical protein